MRIQVSACLQLFVLSAEVEIFFAARHVDGCGASPLLEIEFNNLAIIFNWPFPASLWIYYQLTTHSPALSYLALV